MTTRRFFEILPAALAWGTLVGMVVFSWLIPAWMAVFIILFDTYWLLKTVYMSFHLRSTYITMRRNMKTDWIGKLEDSRIANRESRIIQEPDRVPVMSTDWQDIYHLVILPMYHEPYEIVRETFESLMAAHYPKEKMIVVLGLEERGGAGARATGERIEKEYDGKFFKFLATVHPKDLPGEIPGKSSNQSWAAKEAKEKIIDPMIFDRESRIANRESLRHEGGVMEKEKGTIRYQNFLVSVFDIDTQPYPEYFGRVTHAFLTSPDPLRAIYQPVPLFVNNIYDAPAPSRVSSFSASFWQMMQQARPECLTSFSSQTLPLTAVLDIGYWQKDIVSEDSRVFWQGFLRYHGDFRVEPLCYPVSMDANVAPTFWGTIKNIYKQQRRWGWGVENVPYMFLGFRRDPLIPKAKKRYWSFNILESFHSLATNSIMIFALGWLPLLLGGNHFNTTVLSYSLPRITRFIVQLSIFGLSGSAIMGVLLLPRKSGGTSAIDYFLYIIQWALVPVTLTLFGAIPALEAQTRLALGGKWRLGFWVTPKSRKAEIRDARDGIRE
jgi:cellulose synthase/poly-beta-1,6-N-acetylglucosamine synthase-like glycosyltransferase